nr:epidermal growth factor receptor substrate [Hymenolepis microstoma]
MSSSVEWAIPPENVKKYENLFENMVHIGDKVSGEVMSKFLRDTKLPVETLRAIWDLSDLDQDGYLDRYEFILTMHLVCVCLEGRPLPVVLPLNLVPPNKRGGVSEPLAIMPPPSIGLSSPNFCSSAGLVAGGFSPTSSILVASAGPPPPLPEWSIPKAEQTQYSAVFLKMDQDEDGLITGSDVHDFFLHSNLPQNVLARIWDLVDLQHTGTLNQEQFIVAVHLANEQVASKCTRELPLSLPAALVPPSLRPVTLEPKDYEESNKLLAEIEKIRKERQSLECSTASSLGIDGHGEEIARMSAALETLGATARSLTAQHAAAERYVADLRNERRAALRNQLSEATDAVRAKKATVDALRAQLTSQQISIRSQEEEVIQLRNAITDRKREETSLLQQVAERRNRVEAVETENKAISARNESEAKKISNLETLREKSLLALDEYAKLLAGDTSVVEPDESFIQLLTAAAAAEKEHVASDALNAGHISTTAMQPLFALNTGMDTFANFLPPPITSSSGSGKNGLFENDPFSPVPSTDAFAVSLGSSSIGPSLDPFEADPFAPSTTDPFSPQVNSSDHSKINFDPNKFDAIFGSAPSELTDYPFTTSRGGNNGNSTNEVGSRKIPPPRPATQPSAVLSKSNKKSPPYHHKSSSGLTLAPKSSSNSNESPKSRLRGAFGKVGGVGNGSRNSGAFRSVSGNSGTRDNTLIASAAINEAEQLRWATRESRRAAQAEEKLRAQEEADLELAIRLSRLEALARGAS